ncbi:hypothetical protein SGA02_24530 [Staphylococcus gallinarum]|uniref:Uncharacterized protein n=1 Tax=Staphylococcus gallinarum TaxID=1293 RepID=A0ABQ0Y5E2_STAGA|nr:hypothetical protein SGA02_24530 [Staphylococcus gallinarum]
MVEEPPKNIAVKHPNNINTPKLLSASMYFFDDFAFITPKNPIDIKTPKYNINIIKSIFFIKLPYPFEYK